jgi:prepilin-type N-terminal cleavage/methylation domain-containing protein
MRRRESGFSLTELAVVMAIVAFLLASTMFTLSAQTEQRNRDETQRRLEQAKELLIAFAIVNGRLPCPGNTTGDEAPPPPPGGGACTNYYPTTTRAFLPARAIGFQPVDASGFGLDGWGNRIRYSVSATPWGTGNAARFTKKHVSTDLAAAWNLAQTPADLVVCSQSPAVPTAIACDAGTSVTNQNTVVAIVFSTGKNTATGGGTGTNEVRNLDGNELFVFRPPDPPTAPGGEFDDQMVWIPVGLLYGRMVSAAVLP